jgi:S1-C subfamily serine protease
VADITPALAKRFGLDEKTKGVIITRTPTHVSSSGLMTDFLGTSWQPGDMIRNVNGSKINTVEQLVQLLSPTDQTVFKVEIEGRGGRSTVEMSVGSPKRHKKNTQKPSLEGTI